MNSPLQNNPQAGRPIRPVNDDIDLMKYFSLFISNLPWFALAVIVCVGIAYMVNKHGTKIYRVTATALIEDQANNSGGIGSSMFGGSDMMAGFGLYPSY